MTYALFLDDERFPADDGRDWKIARSYDEAIQIVTDHGWPSHISFVHDLGDGVPAGLHASQVPWAVAKHMISILKLPIRDICPEWDVFMRRYTDLWRAAQAKREKIAV